MLKQRGDQANVSFCCFSTSTIGLALLEGDRSCSRLLIGLDEVKYRLDAVESRGTAWRSYRRLKMIGLFVLYESLRPGVEVKTKTLLLLVLVSPLYLMVRSESREAKYDVESNVRVGAYWPNDWSKRFPVLPIASLANLNVRLAVLLSRYHSSTGERIPTLNQQWQHREWPLKARKVPIDDEGNLNRPSPKISAPNATAASSFILATFFVSMPSILIRRFTSYQW